MPGSGHLFIALFYLLMYTLLAVCLVLLLVKKFKSRSLFNFCLMLTLFIGLFSYSQMRTIRKMESAHIGVYQLTHYPNCADCMMKLSEDNTYTIKSSKKVIERGGWELVTGDDYYVIELSNGKQFGYNEYRNEGKPIHQ